MTDVAVVIPNWNGAAFLGATLDALVAQTHPPAEVVVVDNGSSDGSADLARRHPLAPLVLQRHGNGGFGAAANDGAAITSATLLAVLNSDARPAPDWLARIVACAAGSEPYVWAWGGVLLAPDGRIESAGDEWRPRGQAFKRSKDDAVDTLPTDPYPVFAPPGAAPVFRRDVFLALGGYEPRFFLYYEDVDLALRANAAGWRALVVPTAYVEHDLGRSSAGRKARRRVRYLVARNSLWAILRNTDLRPRQLLRTSRHELQVARRDKYASAYLAGRLAGLAGAPRCLLERRTLRSVPRPHFESAPT